MAAPALRTVIGSIIRERFDPKLVDTRTVRQRAASAADAVMDAIAAHQPLAHAEKDKEIARLRDCLKDKYQSTMPSESGCYVLLTDEAHSKMQDDLEDANDTIVDLRRQLADVTAVTPTIEEPSNV